MSKQYLHFIILLSVWMTVSCTQQVVKVEVSNNLSVKRTNELVTIQREDLEAHLNCDEPLLVTQESTGDKLQFQTIDLNGDELWESLLILVSLHSRSTETLHITNSIDHPIGDTPKVFGRFVPERKDDFAWENDRIAYRMYGPALEATGEISSGVDVWVKSVEYPIIDKWYADGKYHKDHGEGADLYKVGPTLGCGGLGLLYNDSLHTSQNFTDYRILAQGPLRIVFELDYAEWGPAEHRLTETKRISLDVGQHLNRVESHIKWINPALDRPLMVAGLLAHPQDSSVPVSLNSSDNYMIVYEGIKGDNGALGTALICDEDARNISIKEYGDQYLMPLVTTSTDEVAYWTGAAWSKSPWVNSEASWTDIVQSHIKRTLEPLQVKILN